MKWNGLEVCHFFFLHGYNKYSPGSKIAIICLSREMSFSHEIECLIRKVFFNMVVLYSVYTVVKYMYVTMKPEF